MKGWVPARCTRGPPSMQTSFSAWNASLSLPAAELRLTNSPSKDLEGETTRLFVSDFAGLCAGEAGADFTGEPGSSVAVSFSPENTKNHLRIKVKQKRDGQRESFKKLAFFYLVLIAPACGYLLPHPFVISATSWGCRWEESESCSVSSMKNIH